MKYIFQLIRPINLVIIAFTMYSTRLFLYLYEVKFNATIFQKSGEEIDFFLMVFSTLLIAAAGNMINDYFDVKADRVNKPEKLIITKYVKRRVAILNHWILNLIAFSIAIYLSARNNTLWYVFIHLVSINALWFYSLYFKRRPFIGNLIVAGLTALVPILCGVHFFVHHQLPPLEKHSFISNLNYWIYNLGSKGHFIWILAFFAFSTNISREIIKDIQDRSGDLLLNAKTLPILYGTKKSKWLAAIFLILSPLFFTLLFFGKYSHDFSLSENFIIFLPVILSFCVDFIALIILYKAKTRKALKQSDFLIKISMLLGLLLPFYWLLFI